ncbi:MAG: RDD family protein [Vicinamibacterales bacterium]
MRCPKCGYLGFEATDRCRNCGYDFSLASPLPTGELPLRPPSAEGPLEDLDLGGAGPETPTGMDTEASGFGRRVPRQPVSASALSAASALPAPAAVTLRDATPDGSDTAEDLPLFAPRPAGTPLAVRRPGAEVPRARRTTRPVRVEAPVLPLVAEAPAEAEAPPAATGRGARTTAPEAAGVAARLAAALVDTSLLVGIDAAVFWLTLRIAGLEPTPEGAGSIRLAPMAAFFTVLAFLYLVGFTVGGGQTIGKMLTGIRVTGDDGHSVDLTGAVVRALGCLVSALTLGVLYIPALVVADRRAIHDRMAGTRVVSG